MHTKSIKQIIADLKTRQYTCVDLVQYFLARCKKYQPKLNSFITIADRTALAKASELDFQLAKSARHTLSQLFSIPIAHKDNLCTRGLQTTAASKMLANFIPPYDATCVTRLARSGAINLGKTNMDEFAMGSSNETSFFGPVANPWDLLRVPGGSSGGSAAAVAARLVLGATGTDAGGSVRQPSAFCGVTGIKPTFGLASRHGMIGFAPSLEQIGICARSAEDVAILLNAMLGFDPLDANSVVHDNSDFTLSLNEKLHGLTVGLPRQCFKESLSQNVSTHIDAALLVFTKMGIKIKEINLPHLEYALATYHTIASAECSSSLARFDGVRFGFRDSAALTSLDEMYAKSRNESFGREVKRRIMLGTYVLSRDYSFAYYLQAQKVRRLICSDFHEAFKEVDVILTPTTADTAFRFGEKTKDPVKMYASDMYTLPANLAGLPAISIPMGFSTDGLPTSLQLIGSHFAEAKLLNVAHQYQQHTDWHKRIPKDFT